VLAAAEAYVSRVDTTPVGGRVVWLRDSQRNTSIYYAHLNEILTREGARVTPGDTIGRVGNTGNARTTPPHLHFGLYARRRGPVDPWDFLFQPPAELERVEVELAELGEWVRITGEDIHLRDRPTRRGRILADLPRYTALRVLGGVGTWYRVRLPDGTPGFVAGRLTEGAREPIRSQRLDRRQAVRAEPLPQAPVMAELTHGAEVPVLGTFGSYLLVQPPGGRPGWMEAVSEQN
jgi:SH3-like domain-containing protein